MTSPPKIPTIVALSLIKSYNGFRAVDRLSFEVAPGEILGLVGPNAAGKTTTLRCLCGIIPATAGVIHIGGIDLDRDPIEAKKVLAFVPDEPHLFEYLTVWDHLMLFSKLYGVEDGVGRADKLLGDNGLGDRKYAYPAELSRGMKQKLIIACALLHSPRALVLDEPLTGLDPGAIRRTKRTILQTAQKGAAVIVSSHMLHLVEEVCSRILILQHGRKVLEGSLNEIRSNLPEIDEGADLEEIFMRATGLGDPNE